MCGVGGVRLSLGVMEVELSVTCDDGPAAAAFGACVAR
jgi:hypothetical protein